MRQEIARLEEACEAKNATTTRTAPCSPAAPKNTGGSFCNDSDSSSGTDGTRPMTPDAIGGSGAAAGGGGAAGRAVGVLQQHRDCAVGNKVQQDWYEYSYCIYPWTIKRKRWEYVCTKA